MVVSLWSAERNSAGTTGHGAGQRPCRWRSIRASMTEVIGDPASTRYRLIRCGAHCAARAASRAWASSVRWSAARVPTRRRLAWSSARWRPRWESRLTASSARAQACAVWVEVGSASRCRTVDDWSSSVVISARPSRGCDGVGEECGGGGSVNAGSWRCRRIRSLSMRARSRGRFSADAIAVPSSSRVRAPLWSPASALVRAPMA